MPVVSWRYSVMVINQVSARHILLNQSSICALTLLLFANHDFVHSQVRDRCHYDIPSAIPTVVLSLILEQAVLELSTAKCGAQALCIDS